MAISTMAMSDIDELKGRAQRCGDDAVLIYVPKGKGYRGKDRHWGRTGRDSPQRCRDDAEVCVGAKKD